MITSARDLAAGYIGFPRRAHSGRRQMKTMGMALAMLRTIASANTLHLIQSVTSGGQHAGAPAITEQDVENSTLE